MMAKLSKRAQVEALGWMFKAVPHFFAAGALWHDPATGLQSPECWDYKRPDGWTVTPPPGFPASPRRFDTSSCSGLHSSAGWLALIGLIWLTLGGIIGVVWLTLRDFGRTLSATDLHSSTSAHARWD